MKKILMLGTGGTIASEITESGLSPQLTTEQILHYCPDISGFCSVDCLQLCNLDSPGALAANGGFHPKGI